MGDLEENAVLEEIAQKLKEEEVAAAAAAAAPKKPPQLDPFAGLKNMFKF